ncbi:MAG: hypothetical protein M1816_007286 [Peltula sp. TS41687]|nr:MAG: hypothetical protein M1816_007286 [Peltula sp. TS41687]
MALHRALHLPHPWTPSTKRTPLLINGGSTAVGAFAIKLARLANIHPILAIAGAGMPFVSSLLDPSQGDVAIDRRQGPDGVRAAIRAALPKENEAHGASGGGFLRHALDAVSEVDTLRVTLAELAPEGGARVAYVLPPDEEMQNLLYGEGKSFEAEFVMSGDLFSMFGPKPDAEDFGFVYLRALARWLAEGRLKGHPFEVVDGGLDGVQWALEELQAGRVSGKKYLFRVAETKGIR